MATIGMSVPGASSLFTGNSLADQVAGETEEEKRKRLAGLMESKMLPTAAGASSLGLGYGTALGQR